MNTTMSQRKAKRIVVCCDGTWNTPDQNDSGKPTPTNVVKFARAVRPEDDNGTVQIVFYNQGVGTKWGLDRFLGGAFGTGLNKHVEDAYRFIIDNYLDGDEIYLFGFSRGAYTARSVGGMIRNCGIIKKAHADRIPEAYKLYRSSNPDDKPEGPNAKRFIDKYCHKHDEVRIKFVGVWDTVGALGVPGRMMGIINRRHQFHDVKLSSTIDHAYHALAIDEKRGTFKPTLWEVKPGTNQKVEQVWFAGVHSNVGGGYRDSGLSDIAFHWMKEKAEAVGLVFDEEYIGANFSPNPIGELRNSLKRFFAVMPRYVRPVCMKKEWGEALHPSVDRRYQEVANWRPENLEEYRRRVSQNGAEK
jgi:uncharacterized protein (DUF2235 family)